MPDHGLTPQQARLLGYLRAEVERTGTPPSYQQMADALGLRSKSGAHRLVQALLDRGAVRAIPGRARAIMPVEVGTPLADSIRHVLRDCTLRKATRRELEAMLEAE